MSIKKKKSYKENRIGVDCSGNKYESRFKQGHLTEVTVKKETRCLSL